MLHTRNLSLFSLSLKTRRHWTSSHATSHLPFLLQEVLEQFPLLFPKAIRLPQLSGGVLLGLLPQVVTVRLGEAGHAWERLQEQDIRKLLERSHGAAVQLLKPREPHGSDRSNAREVWRVSLPDVDFKVLMLSTLTKVRATLKP